MMINVTELKRKVIDEFLTIQSSVTNTPFKSVARIYTGESTNAEEKAKYSIKTDNCYPYVSTKDISMKGSVNFENGMYIPKGIKKFSIAPVNSILLCIEGGNAGNKIAIIKEATCFVNKLCCFDIFDADNRFIYYYLLSNQFRNNFKEQMTGLIGGVSVKKLKELLLPLPDITEQNRIADKLDEIFAELDKIDEKQTRLATIQEKMEAKILKLAIQGKLVEQRPEEGTGEELFKLILEEKQELIKQGKIKKEKTLPPIVEGEIPFEIPSTWKWVRLSDICEIPITDGTHQTPTYSSKDEGVPFISSKDVTTKAINWNNIKYITKDLHKELYKRIAPQKNDILLAKNGTTGVAALVEDDRVFDIYVTLAVLRPTRNLIYPKFLLNVVNSPVCKGQFNEHLIGIGVPNLHLNVIKEVMIPLPPLEEQKRIVAKIEELLPLCRGN